jgi:hypothetical protein
VSQLRTELLTEVRAELLPQTRIGRSRDAACVGMAMCQDCLRDVVVATREDPMP